MKQEYRLLTLFAPYRFLKTGKPELEKHLLLGWLKSEVKRDQADRCICGLGNLKFK